MTPHLFVYGTLCQDCSGEPGSLQRARLAREATLIGPAEVRGRLVDLGRYPGLVDGPGRVSGLLLRLARPAATLAWLDAYEDIGPDGEYDRVAIMPLAGSVSDGGVRTVASAWTYRLRNLPPTPRFVAGGRWTGREVA